MTDIRSSDTKSAENLDLILDAMTRLRQNLRAAESVWAPQIARVHSSNESSAINTAHYWALRQDDLRRLQNLLVPFGLSSLGRCAAHVDATLAAIAAAAAALSGKPQQAASDTPTQAVSFAGGEFLLRTRTEQLLGPEPENRPSRIMVTLPSTAAADRSLVADLLDRGMNLARINCAHDDPPTWETMIAQVRHVSAAAGVSCRIAMDLAGPKLRTGPLEDGPGVVKLRPAKDAYGRVTAPAWCRLTAADPPTSPTSPPPAIPVDAGWLHRLRPGDHIRLRDTRGSARTMTVTEVTDGTALCYVGRTTYLGTGTTVKSRGRRAVVGELPAIPRYLTLSAGDVLELSRDCRPAPVPPVGSPRIGCTLPEVFDHVASGHTILFDDGKISGIVIDHDSDTVTVRITEAGEHGRRLRAGKGINLPDSDIAVAALTRTDRANLAFAVENADIVELSFVRTARDVEDLLAALNALGDTKLGVVVKIETAQGFRNLPAILLTAMRRPNTGVMIARGDLAVECGYERLAELQEEILWLCEAAHLPVIWATQVLDQLARSGQPSRAEITDAAMSGRAECVMLNKGPRIGDAVSSLDDILRRMSGNAFKQTLLMRSLHSWSRNEL